LTGSASLGVIMAMHQTSFPEPSFFAYGHCQLGQSRETKPLGFSQGAVVGDLLRRQWCEFQLRPEPVQMREPAIFHCLAFSVAM
jgi:hypothetical protein